MPQDQASPAPPDPQTPATTTPSDSSSSLDAFRTKYPQYKNIPDDRLADALYNKFYADKLSRDDFNLKLGLVQAPPPEKPPTPDQAPNVEVGGGVFTTASAAAQPFVDTAAGIVQHGATLLHSIGFPVDPDAAAKVAQNIREGYSEFKGQSQRHYNTSDEEHPYLAAGGDVAGQILLYSATGPTGFAESAFAKVLPRAGAFLGRLVMRSAQGGALGALQTKPGEDVGSNAFWSAAGSAFGEGGASLAAKGAVKVANAQAISRLIGQARNASRGWVGDNLRLSQGFQAIKADVDQQTRVLSAEADRLKAKDTITSGTGSVTYSPETKAAIADLDQHKEDTAFFRNKVFSKLSKTEDETGGAGATHPKESNDQVLSYIMGSDRVASKTVYNGLSAPLRDLARKGVFYKALEKSTSSDGKIDPVKLRNALNTPGVQGFFEKTFKGKEIIRGFTNLVEEGNNIAVKHPYILAHGVSRLSGQLVTGAGLGGATYGAERARGAGEVESGVAGFVVFFSMLYGVNRLVGSQAGLNLLSAAGKVTPGTPAAGKAFARFAHMVGAPIGATAGQSISEGAADSLNLSDDSQPSEPQQPQQSQD